MAKLPLFQSSIRELQMMNTQWKSILDPVLSIPMLSGIQLKNINVVSGNNVINHRLQRNYQGYLVTGMRGAFVQLYDSISQTPDLTLRLNSNGTAVLDLWIW